MIKIKKILLAFFVFFLVCFCVLDDNFIDASQINIDQKVENTSLRGKNYKIYNLNNGNMKLEYYFEPIHYFTLNGYLEYEYEINEIADYFVKEYDTYSVRIPNKINSGKYIEYSIGKEEVKFSLDFGEELNGQLENCNGEQIIVYKNSKGEICLEVVVAPQYVKFFETTNNNNIDHTQMKIKNVKKADVRVDNNVVNYVNDNSIVSFQLNSSCDNNIVEKTENINCQYGLITTNNILDHTNTFIFEDDYFSETLELTVSNSTNDGSCVSFNSLMEDKFIIEGTSNYFYTPSELKNNKIGMKSTGLMGENDEPLTYKMKQIINLNLMIDKIGFVDSVNNFSVVYKRTGGRTINAMSNVSLSANRISSTIEYNEINGVSAYDTQYISTGVFDSLTNECRFDLTDEVVEYLENDSTEDFLVEIDSQGFNSYNYQTEDMIQFGSCRSLNSKPYVSVEFSTSAQGAALIQGQLENNSQYVPQESEYNCFGYALNKIADLKLKLTQQEAQQLNLQYYSFSHYLASKLYEGEDANINDLKELVMAIAYVKYGISMRELTSLDANEAPIYQHEYRIAFRIGYSDNYDSYKATVNSNSVEKDMIKSMLETGQGIDVVELNAGMDYHFIRQNKRIGSTMIWSGKNGLGELELNINLSTYTWSNYYDSDIVYFAVSIL